jgi:hypothetical protein
LVGEIEPKGPFDCPVRFERDGKLMEVPIALGVGNFKSSIRVRSVGIVPDDNHRPVGVGGRFFSSEIKSDQSDIVVGFLGYLSPMYLRREIFGLRGGTVREKDLGFRCGWKVPEIFQADSGRGAVGIDARFPFRGVQNVLDLLQNLFPVVEMSL